MSFNKEYAKIQMRRDTSVNWATANPLLLSGEIGYEIDTRKMKFGNGTQPWSSLPYFTEETLNYTEPPTDGKLYGRTYTNGVYLWKEVEAPDFIDGGSSVVV